MGKKRPLLRAQGHKELEGSKLEVAPSQYSGPDRSKEVAMRGRVPRWDKVHTTGTPPCLLQPWGGQPQTHWDEVTCSIPHRSPSMMDSSCPNPLASVGVLP